MKITKFVGAPTVTPWPELGQLENRLHKLFYDPFNFTFFTPDRYTPPVQIEEREKEYLVTVELPGMKKDDVEIEYEDGVLIIRGEKIEEYEERKPPLLVWERQYGAFQRSFVLPKSVATEQVQAEFKDGILMIVLPKTEKARGRKIHITQEAK